MNREDVERESAIIEAEIAEEEKRKIYTITDLGNEVLALELKRIKRLYRTAQEGI